MQAGRWRPLAPFRGDCLDLPGDDGIARTFPERIVADQDLAEHHAQGVDIGSLVDRLSRPLVDHRAKMLW